MAGNVAIVLDDGAIEVIDNGTPYRIVVYVGLRGIQRPGTPQNPNESYRLAFDSLPIGATS